MKQSLVTEKNRKIRRMRELYPEINVKLLYRRDFHRILAKHGFGPLAQTDVQGIDKVLLTARQIQQKVGELGRQISQDYKDRQPVLVGVLTGMMCFMADLMREITLPVEIEFMAISRYGKASQRAVRITKDLESDILGRDVVLVEDIVDSGMTLNYLRDYLESKRPASLKVCALLDKRARRIVEVAFEVPDEFVVGYGLDFLNKYRNLPFIGALRPEESRLASKKKPAQVTLPICLPATRPSAANHLRLSCPRASNSTTWDLLILSKLRRFWVVYEFEINADVSCMDRASVMVYAR